MDFCRYRKGNDSTTPDVQTTPGGFPLQRRATRENCSRLSRLGKANSSTPDRLFGLGKLSEAASVHFRSFNTNLPSSMIN